MAGAAEGTGERYWGSWSLMRAGAETPTRRGCHRSGGEGGAGRKVRLRQERSSQIASELSL